MDWGIYWRCDMDGVEQGSRLCEEWGCRQARTALHMSRREWPRSFMPQPPASEFRRVEVGLPRLYPEDGHDEPRMAHPSLR